MLASAVLLVLPASALAQSAGDEQYTDPLQGAPAPQEPAPSPQEPAPESPDSTGVAPTSPVDPGTSAAPGTTADSTTGGSAAATGSGSTDATLPYTGVDARLPLSAGAILLGLGIMLSLRLSRPGRL